MNKKACVAVVFASVMVLLVAIASPMLVLAAALWDVQTIDETATLAGRLSIAVDSKDNPHLVYIVTETGSSYTSSNRFLAYASWNGTSWSTQKIAKGEGVGYTSLAFDSNDNLYATYTDGVYEENDTYVPYVKVAIRAESGWRIQTIDKGGSGSIGLDSMGKPHIAYTGANGLLKYARLDGLNWTIQTVDPDSERALTSLTVQYLALDSENRPHIVYTVNSSVRYAASNSSGWVIQNVLSSNSIPIGNLVLDSNNVPHFTCVINDSVTYASLNGSLWNLQTVASIYTDWDGSFVRLDANDYPHITYPYGSSKVNLARWNGTGWNTQRVTNAAFSWGNAMPLAFDSEGRPHLCYMNLRTTGYSYLDGSVIYATSNESVTTPTLNPTPSPSPSESPLPSPTISPSPTEKVPGQFRFSWVEVALAVFILAVGGVAAYFLRRSQKRR